MLKPIQKFSHIFFKLLKIQIMRFTLALGADMSKDWFNVCLMNKQFEVLFEKQVINRSDEINVFISEILERQDISSIGSLLLCVEHTGLYIQNLVRGWISKGGQLSVVGANQISQSMTGPGGWVDKTDTLDAHRIAEYAVRFSDKLKCYQMKDHSIEMLQRLQRQRTRLLNVLYQLQVPVKESTDFDRTTIVEQIVQNQAGTIAAIKADLKTIEKQIQTQIDRDPYLNRIFKLTKSVAGVGPVTATEIIIATEGFTKFDADQAKKFARYSGVIPLPHSSGTSIRKKRKTTMRANGRLKRLLTMGALSVIQIPGEMQQYYQRKKKEGKHHMCVLNALRNKIILRVFAVVRNDTMYTKEFKYLQ